MKLALIFFSIVAIVLGLVGYSQVFHSVAPIAAQCSQYLPNDQQAYNQCVNNASVRAAPGAGWGFLALVGGGVALFISWILGLISTVMRRSWGWFVAVLLFTPAGTLLYGFFGPAGEPSVARRANGPGLAVGGFVAPPSEMVPGRCWQCGGGVKIGSAICLNCGATQAPAAFGPSQISRSSGFDPDANMGAFPTTKSPILGMSEEAAQASYPASNYGQPVTSPEPSGNYGPPDAYGPPAGGQGGYGGYGAPPDPYGPPAGPPPGYGPGYGQPDPYGPPAGPPPGYGQPPDPYGQPPGYGPGYGQPPDPHGPPDPYGQPPDPYGPPPGPGGWGGRR